MAGTGRHGSGQPNQSLVEGNVAQGDVIHRALKADMKERIRSGVNGTPTIFINDLRHDGSFDFGTLAEAIADAAEEIRR